MRKLTHLALLVAFAASAGADDGKPEASPDPVPGQRPKQIELLAATSKPDTAPALSPPETGGKASIGDGTASTHPRMTGMPEPVDSVPAVTAATPPGVLPPASTDNGSRSSDAATPASQSIVTASPALHAAASSPTQSATSGPILGPGAAAGGPMPLDTLDAASQHFVDGQRDRELAYAAQLREAQREVSIIELKAKAADLEARIRKSASEGAPPQAPVIAVEAANRKEAPPPPPPPPPPPTLKSIIGSTAVLAYNGQEVHAKAGDKLGVYKVESVTSGTVVVTNGKEHTELHTVW